MYVEKYLSHYYIVAEDDEHNFSLNWNTGHLNIHRFSINIDTIHDALINIIIFLYFCNVKVLITTDFFFLNKCLSHNFISCCGITTPMKWHQVLEDVWKAALVPSPTDGRTWVWPRAAWLSPGEVWG